MHIVNIFHCISISGIMVIVSIILFGSLFYCWKVESSKHRYTTMSSCTRKQGKVIDIVIINDTDTAYPVHGIHTTDGLYNSLMLTM